MTKISSLLSHCQSALEAAPRILIAFSGGMDSSVLLKSVAQNFPNKILLAIHVNHQLHTESDQWETHCREVATDFGVPFVSEKIGLHGQSGVEQRAREARYQVFQKYLEPDDVLLTGHHADDQVETFLFRLFRGSGIKGLAGIPMSRSLGRGRLLRPLLGCSRQELKALALSAEIEWIEDPSNEDTQFDRNYLRNTIIPSITDRWNKADKQIISAADRFNDLDNLLSEVADQDLDACLFRTEAVGVSIDIAPLKQLTPLRQDNLLRRYIYSYQGTQPNQQVLKTLRSDILNATPDSQPLLRHVDIEIRRFDGRLFLLPPMPEISAITSFESDWLPDKGSFNLAGIWEIHRLNHVDRPLSITLRGGGERAKPLGREHSQTVKKLLLENRVEPWLRDYLPIIYSEDEIVAIGDRILCANFQFQMQWLIEQNE